MKICSQIVGGNDSMYGQNQQKIPKNVVVTLVRNSSKHTQGKSGNFIFLIEWELGTTRLHHSRSVCIAPTTHVTSVYNILCLHALYCYFFLKSVTYFEQTFVVIKVARNTDNQWISMNSQESFFYCCM